MSRRVWPLAGVGAFLALLIEEVATGGAPDDSDSTSAVISYYSAHQGSIHTALFAYIVAAVLIAFFASYLQSSVRASTAQSALRGAILVGGALVSVGLLVDVVIGLTLLHAALGGQAAVVSTANLLAGEAWPLVMGGLSVFCLAAGIAAVRGYALTRWLGWLGIVIGLMALAPAPVGPIDAVAGLVWLLAAAITLAVGEFRSERQPATVSATNAQRFHEPAETSVR